MCPRPCSKQGFEIRYGSSFSDSTSQTTSILLTRMVFFCHHSFSSGLHRVGCESITISYQYSGMIREEIKGLKKISSANSVLGKETGYFQIVFEARNADYTESH